MNQDQLADFESLVVKHGLCITKDKDLYRSHVVGWMWLAYQAALESPEVQGLRDALVIAEDMLCKQENELRSFGAHEPCAESAILTARAALADMEKQK